PHARAAADATAQGGGAGARRRSGRRYRPGTGRAEAGGDGGEARLRPRHAAAGDRRIYARPHAERVGRMTPGQRRDMARLISRAARGEALPPLPEPPNAGRVVALTGGGGVGKSSLTGRLIEAYRDRGLTGAVLACDPQSPVSGGALLGDRFRMPSRPDDEGVFIRSLAAPSGGQAVAGHLATVVAVCRSFGFERVLIETVGAGQGDTAV